MLRLKDAPVVESKEMGARMAVRKDEHTLTMPKEMKTPGSSWHRSKVIELMAAPENNFKPREVEITGILCDEPGMYSGKHGHMEAVLYVLDGEGYSVIDGEKVQWKKGTLLHVTGPQTIHQHFNTGKTEAKHLRLHYGLRFGFFQATAKRVFPYLYYEYSAYRQNE